VCGLRAEITRISLIFVELLEYEERKRGIELPESIHREDYCTTCKIRTGPGDQIFKRICQAYQIKKRRGGERERERICPECVLYIAELLAAAHFKKPGQ